VGFYVCLGVGGALNTPDVATMSFASVLSDQALCESIQPRNRTCAMVVAVFLACSPSCSLAMNSVEITCRVELAWVSCNNCTSRATTGWVGGSHLHLVAGHGHTLAFHRPRHQSHLRVLSLCGRPCTSIRRRKRAHGV
jgi:hypothetical protein